MRFDDAEDLIRVRFAEPLGLLNQLSPDPAPTDRSPTDQEKALKALWLVSLYGAFEKSINIIVETCIAEISSHLSASNQCKISAHSLFSFQKIQAMNGCSKSTIFSKSLELFRHIEDDAPVQILGNPLADMLQNIDGRTLVDVASIFGAEAFEIELSVAGRLNNLRERRNAIAHGRELGKDVGARFRKLELQRLYEVVDFQTMRFFNHMKLHCTDQRYKKSAA